MRNVSVRPSLHAVEWLLQVAGICVLIYLPYFWFCQADFENRPQITAMVSLIGAAVLLLAAPAYSAYSRHGVEAPRIIAWAVVASGIWFIIWLIQALFFVS